MPNDMVGGDVGHQGFAGLGFAGYPERESHAPHKSAKKRPARGGHRRRGKNASRRV
jgi:hypothetical protein